MLAGCRIAPAFRRETGIDALTELNESALCKWRRYYSPIRRHCRQTCFKARGRECIASGYGGDSTFKRSAVCFPKQAPGLKLSGLFDGTVSEVEPGPIGGTTPSE
jgi:hypothetical protein